MRKVIKSDWVTTANGGKGIVRRVAKDGSWADVNWGGWSKRMPVSSLIVKTTLDIGDGWMATDMARERELEGVREDENRNSQQVS